MASTLFSTERCIVKPLQKEDFPEILEMYQELDSNKYVPPLKDKTPEEHLAFLELKIRNNEKELGFWTARKKENGRLVGTVNLNFFEALNVYHAGCHLSRFIWNQGFATELLNEVIYWGGQTKGLKEIHAIVMDGNKASQKLMTKVNLKFIRSIADENQLLHIYRKDIF